MADVVISESGTKVDKPPRRMRLVNTVARIIATGFGTGYSPWGPGTVGSAAAAIFYYFLLADLSWVLQLFVILLVTAVGIWACGIYGKETGVADDRRMVVDEWVGMWVTLWAFAPSWEWVVVGFVLFRILDIFKVFPANWIDRRMKGADGVVLDDLVSGVYAHLLLRAIYRLWALS